MPPNQDLVSKALDIIKGIPGDISSFFSPAPQPTQQHGMTTDQAVQSMAKYGWRQENPSPTPQPSAIPGNSTPQNVTPLQSSGVPGLNQSNIDWLEKNVLPITRSQGFPDPLVAGQWAIEDRKKDTSMFNLRVGGSVHTYQNIQNNVNDYMLTVKNILSQKGYNIADMKDPKQILNALQQGNTRYEGHSKDPMQYVDWTSNTPEYKYYANQGGK